jgi:tetratricopeptide (TPR) repeat protein
VAAAPSSYQARDRYLLVALTKGRYEEAKNQTEILRERGDTARALAFRAAVLYGQHEFVAAADTMEVAWRNLPSDFGAPDMEQSPFAWAMAVFGAAGRTEAAQRAVDTTFGRWSGRAPDRLPIFGPDGPLVPKQPLIDLFTSIMGTNITPLRNGKRDWDALQAFQQHFPRDTTILRRTIAALGMQVELLFTAMLSGDDEILRRLAPLLPEAQRELGNAILTLSQGDATAATRMLAAIQQRRASEDHIAPAEAGLWAAVAARLGRTEDAIDLYAYFEEIPLSGIPGGTLVRSWAERGALYQQLGDESRAIEMYEKVIEALETGDAEVQPLVDRARDALAALTGETAPRRR